MKIFRSVLFAVVMLSLLISAKAQTLIPPNDPHIIFTGSHFNKISDTTVVFGRFTDEVLSLPPRRLLLNTAKARTNTGITVQFRTDAPSVVARFVMDTTGVNRNNRFGVYADGDSVGEVAVRPAGKDVRTAYDIAITSPAAGMHTYMITLPPFCTMVFKGLTLPEGETLSDLSLPGRPVYIAYGNSITHGQGQQKTEQTYPFLLAREMGWQMYNLGVGGAKTSLPVAEMIRDRIPHVDYMTVLIGYNDWVFLGLDPAQYGKVLKTFLRTAREKHPETRIFVITQTFTLTKTSKVGIPLDEYRKKQREVIASLHESGDSLLYLIRGEEITGPAGLRDKVHFNITGARTFSLKLGGLPNLFLGDCSYSASPRVRGELKGGGLARLCQKEFAI